MKIHRHLFVKLSVRAGSSKGQVMATYPSYPATPFIWVIAAAKRPPNEPASAAAEKKSAARKPSSCRLYQQLGGYLAW